MALLATGLAMPVGAGAHEMEARSATIATFSGAADVGGTGDFDGRARVDLVLGAAPSAPFGRDGAGAVFVTSARHGGTSSLEGGDGVVRIAGATAGDRLSRSCVAGDVNGDGLDDLLLGAPGADTANGADSGGAHVVFGSGTGKDVDLAELTDDRGFTITGAGEGHRAGHDVGCPGDVDSDGVPDLVVAAPGAGATYVVFGRSDGPVDLRLFDLMGHGLDGFRIDTASPGRRGLTTWPEPVIRTATDEATFSLG